MRRSWGGNDLEVVPHSNAKGTRIIERTGNIPTNHSGNGNVSVIREISTIDVKFRPSGELNTYVSVNSFPTSVSGKGCIRRREVFFRLIRIRNVPIKRQIVGDRRGII